jgi:type IV pilus assembly protein PilC
VRPSVRDGWQEFFRPRVPRREQVLLTRQLGTLLAAGLPLVESLQVLREQTGSAALEDILADVASEVRAGGSLAEALARHPRVFPSLYTGMVAAGEFSGTLDSVLRRLADLTERGDAMAGKIRGALLYPVAVLFVAMISVVLLLVLVIPTFELMFAQAEVPLPLPTRFVLALSRGLAAWWWLLVGVASLTVVWAGRLLRTPEGLTRRDRMLLTLPLLGPIQRKAGASRLARILGTLLGAGVPLVDALNLSARTVDNRVLEGVIRLSERSVMDGGGLADALRISGEIPPLLTQMVQVGEQTGALDDMLARVADLFEDEVERSLSSLVSIVEPGLVVLLGLVVGGMIMAMYLPIFDMAAIVG